MTDAIAAATATTRPSAVQDFSQFDAALIDHPGDDWRRAERELSEAGHPLPLFARREFVSSQRESETSLLVVRDRSGRHRAAVAVHKRAVREIPGHYVLHADRFASATEPAALRPAAYALAAMLRRNTRALRMDLDVFTRDPARRDEATSALEEAGFQAADSSSYLQTLVLDLAPTEEEIFASFRGSARRKVRALDKHPLELRCITEVAYATRLEALAMETLRRTAGTYVAQDWRGRIELSKAHPHLSRIAGVFRTDRDGPEALVSFMWGAMHGDHGQYRDGGSTRVEWSVPLSYAPMWDLMKWSRQQGAHWFDLGGVTDGRTGDADDPLGGISEFKRHFTSNVERVGDGWQLPATTLRARAARALGTARALVRGWRQRA